MPEISKEELGGIMDKYNKEISTQLGERAARPVEEAGIKGGVKSREYSQFKSEYLPPQLSWYEKACNFTEKLIKLTPDKKIEGQYKDAIATCHLNITPTGANSLAIMGPAAFAFLAASISFILTGGMFFPMFSIVLAAAAWRCG